MKYKKGDRVIVRSWESMEREFGLDNNGYIKVHKKFVPWMKEYCGRTLTIAYRRKDYYGVIEDDNQYFWSDDMFVRENTIAALLNKRH